VVCCSFLQLLNEQFVDAILVLGLELVAIALS